MIGNHSISGAISRRLYVLVRVHPRRVFVRLASLTHVLLPGLKERIAGIGTCARAILIGAEVFFLSGCTIAQHYEEDKIVSRSLGVGAVRLPDCTSRGSHSEVTTLGLSLAKDRALLGFHSSNWTCLPLDSCTAIFFVSDEREASAVRRQFPDIASACVIKNRP